MDGHNGAMAILGAHESIAGGYYKAVEIAQRVGCDCVQLFTKNNNQWRAKPISDEEAGLFKAALKRLKIKHPVSHASYLINLATPDAELWGKSIDSMIVEMQRAEQLGIPCVVVHPGAYTTSSLEAGLRRAAAALDEVHLQLPGLKTRVLLETTSGQGSCLGCRFEHLAEIIGAAADPERIGVCVDTCHIFSAGYALGTPEEYATTMRELDKIVGLKLVKAIHLNDSKARFGSGVDRHAHIGRGEMGLEPFRLLLNDRRFRRVPMYIETKKGEEEGRDLDEINLEVLRGLIA
jgi:deoxyribonuclease-4